MAFGYFQESKVDFGVRLGNTALESTSGQLLVTPFPVRCDSEITLMIIKDGIGWIYWENRTVFGLKWTLRVNCLRLYQKYISVHLVRWKMENKNRFVLVLWLRKWTYYGGTGSEHTVTTCLAAAREVHEYILPFTAVENSTNFLCLLDRGKYFCPGNFSRRIYLLTEGIACL